MNYTFIYLWWWCGSKVKFWPLEQGDLSECVCVTPERYIPTGPDPFCRARSELPCRPPEDKHKKIETYIDCFWLVFQPVFVLWPLSCSRRHWFCWFLFSPICLFLWHSCCSSHNFKFHIYKRWISTFTSTRCCVSLTVIKELDKKDFYQLSPLEHTHVDTPVFPVLVDLWGEFMFLWRCVWGEERIPLSARAAVAAARACDVAPPPPAPELYDIPPGATCMKFCCGRPVDWRESDR